MTPWNTLERANGGVHAPRLCRKLGAALLLLCVSTAAAAFGFEDVVDKARKLADKPYQPPEQVPQLLRDINYDQWRDIRFQPENALWHQQDLPFEVQFFHPGLYYDRTVAINVVRNGEAQPLRFDTKQFDYGKNDFADRIPDNLGFAGFRIHAPFKNPEYADEVAVFLGASYLRAVGKPNSYGLSARGLAVDTASPNGEEFPWFREFWLVKPEPGADTLTLYALLDSQRVAGAYKYVIRPGEETVVDVESVVFPRQAIERMGVAPLTSMYFYGEPQSLRPVNDFRPEIHDSDGLMIAMDTGEWLWRPLLNPERLLVNAFSANNPRGFGLLQRDVDFDHYQDLEARYDIRPSAWVTPKNDWGEGSVLLVQIPTTNELNDNIVAFWTPKAPVKPGQELKYDYRIAWFKADRTQHEPPGGHVVATRTGNHHAVKGEIERMRKFVIDFQGGELTELSADAPVEATVDVGAGAKLVEQHVVKNPITNGWRLVFRIRTDKDGPLDRVLPAREGQPVELRAFLRRGNDVLTETWSYALQP